MRATQDPVALGLADSLGHPGRNVTGVTSISPDLHGKRFELLREVMGRQRQIAVLWNPKVEIRQVQLADMRHAGEALGLRTAFVEVTNADEVRAAFASDALKRAGGLTVIRDPLIVSHRAEIAGLAIAAHLPSVFDERDYALAGGLMSYGANVGELYRRAAGYVDKVLRGARPGDLPIEQPTKFELVVNLKTARALGITLPPPILARADEVIE
jgi:putative ABC transport system substrate-binding protein